MEWVYSFFYRFKRRLILTTINGGFDYSFVFRIVHKIKSKPIVKSSFIVSNDVNDIAKAINGDLKISILLPVYETPISFLKEAINSVLNQSYQNWELCISDDNSPSEEVRQVIKDFAKTDSRIKYVFRKENGHISINTNSALEIASGDFIAFFDHDDILNSKALEKVYNRLIVDLQVDLVYTDEDKIDERGNRCLPHRKPAWSPDTLLTRNYITHFVVARKSIVDSLGGLRVGVEGSQDHDFLLRFAEKSQRIEHIPEILYHWRIHSESVASELGAKPYVITASKKAIQDSLDRQGVNGIVRMYPNLPLIFHIDYSSQSDKSVAIIWKGVTSETQLISSNLKRAGKINYRSYYQEEELNVASRPKLNNEDFVLYIHASLEVKTIGWLAKLANAMNYSFRSVLTSPIYTQQGFIYSFGLDEKGNKKFNHLFQPIDDDHDYYASSLNIDYYDEIFFMKNRNESNKYNCACLAGLEIVKI